MATETTQTLARFDDLATARRCLATLRRRQLFNPGMNIKLQYEKQGHGELPISYTHSWAGFVKGAALGGIAGVVFGIAFTLFQFEQVTALFIAPFLVFGTVMGAFGGALTGAMNPEKSIDETERAGGASLMVESRDATDVEWSRQTMARFGGIAVGEMPPAPVSSNGALGGVRRPLESRA